MTRLFHITHIDHLPSILAEGGLWCDNKRIIRGLETINIAHRHIKESRAHVQVPTAHGGTVDHYVPFYFAPRSPMLGAIHVGKVEEYRGGQRMVVHLETTIEHIRELSIPFTFTNGGADSDQCKFFEDLGLLQPIVDYVTKDAFKFWFKDAEHPDRTFRRNAEFLVYNFVPWRVIQRIGVIDAEIQRRVQGILFGAPSQPEIIVDPRWYF